MMRSIWAAAALLAAILPLPASAQPGQEVRSGEAVSLSPARAYILYRILYPDPKDDYRYEVVLVRQPTASELRAAAAGQESAVTPNVMVVKMGRQFEDWGQERAYLLSVPPGVYIVAGESLYGLKAAVGTCLCMGTVSFEAKAGTITDAGYILAAMDGKPTQIPELAGHTNPGADYDSRWSYVMAVRPYREGMRVPAALAALPRVPADYRAVGKFANPFGMTINRMVPIPGVLDYDEDRVIDVKAGK